MHWFWRSAIAVVAAVPFGFLAAIFASMLSTEIQLRGLDGGLALIVGIVFCIIPLVLTLLFYGYLTRRYGPRADSDRQTRCRQCGYILRGISEPRCPECGERI